MNKIIIEITNCQVCSDCDHNGLLQSHPKYICRNYKVRGRGKVDAKYWYDQPILGAVNKENGRHIDIPDWCPRLNRKGELNEAI